MGGMYQFFKSTILGGLIVLLPVILIAAILGWVIDIALKVILPVFNWLPDKSIGGISLTLVSTILIIVFCCFLAGFFAETTLLRFLRVRVEKWALFIPGYSLMKNVGADLAGVKEKNPAKTVLVRFEASWQLGFLMETLGDGRLVIFIPGVPRALVGSLHIVAADRVDFLNISISESLDILGRLGVGLNEQWKLQ